MRKLMPVVLLSLLVASLPAQYDAARYPVIPKPSQLLPFSGSFSLTAETVILTDGKTFRKEIEFFRRQVKQLYGIELKYASKAGKGNFIYVSSDSAGVAPEGYQLFVNSGEISLYGGQAGVFYGMQTLLQLITPNPKQETRNLSSPNSQLPTPDFFIPSCSILDQPRFSWRGMHLDVSRHFFPKENIKEYLRWMATYKLNTFHWHLTDDQGWRIEIKKYPKLTETGAWRSGTLIGHYSETPDRYDTTRYGGYYTQKDIREIVKYADSLHITIVPEIEMPGHASAMLAAYPNLGCTPGPFDVARTWGVFEDVLCPTEETFTFLGNVLTEVCALFPGKYVHIGGDECPKERWKASAFCQATISKHNLKDEHGLQSWFVQRIVKMLEKKGKHAIGWDEILEGGLADGAAVMSWRGEDGGIAAAKAKHFVVMSPGSHCYFDHYQSQSPDEPLAIGGYLPIEKVYSYDPVPAVLNAEEKKFILGAQANVWTEYMSYWMHVQYMVFPRICALAEVVWTEPGNKEWKFFQSRLIRHLDFLEKMNVKYAESLFELKATVTADPGGNGLWLALTSPTNSPIYFAEQFDKPVPEGKHKYTGPIHITTDTVVEAFTMKVVDASTLRVGPVLRKEFQVNKATGKTVTLRKAPSSSYNTGGSFALVDGIHGRQPWIGSEWLGWWGDTLDATIDLGKDTVIHTIRLHTLSDTGSWIYSPSSANGFETYYSSDGKTFNYLGYDGTITPVQNGVYTFHSSAPIKCRYLRIVSSSQGAIPEGKPGAGYPAWLFVSEITIE
jgi:hexosaminidase